MNENKYNLKWLEIQWYLEKIGKWDTTYIYLISLYNGSEQIFEILLKKCSFWRGMSGLRKKTDTLSSTQAYPNTIAELWR